MQSHIITRSISAFKPSNTYNFIASWYPFVGNGIPMITDVHRSTNFINLFKNFLVFLIDLGNEASHSFVMHSRVHQAADLFRVGMKIEDLVMN